MVKMPRRSLDTVLDLVAAVAWTANRSDPTRCSMRAFNAARATSPHPDAPTANAIHLDFNKDARVAVSWAEILQLAFRTRDEREPVLRAAYRSREQDWLDVRHLFFALNQVARMLGQTTLVEREYVEGRERMIRRQRRRDPDSEIAELLPSAGQIERIAEAQREIDGADPAISGWGYALRLAGLEPRSARLAPVRRADPRRLSVAQAAAIFAALNGVLPSKPSLIQFAEHAGLPLTGIDQRRWTLVLDDADTLVAADGLPQPPRPKPNGRRVLRFRVPANPLDTRDLLITREQAIEALRRWDRESAGRTRSRREYLSWQVGSPAPAPSTIQRHFGSFSALVTEAITLNTAGAEPLTPTDPGGLKFAPGILTELATIATAEVQQRSTTPKETAPYRGPRPWLSHLIEAGLLSTAEALHADLRGVRYTATFNAPGDITVAGHPPVPTPGAAAELINGSKSNGWSFWRVQRGERDVTLSELRERYTADTTADAA
jgi:hypothetical protein